MMKLYFMSFFLIISVFIPFSIFAETKYISDNLSVYIRRGPGLQYPLSGTLITGDKIETLEVSKDGKFTRIQDKQNRISWVESAVLQDNPVARMRINELESHLSQAQHKLNTTQRSQNDIISQTQGKLAEAESIRKKLIQENQALLSQYENQKKRIIDLENQLTKNQRNIVPNWFFYGGIVAGGGLLLGLLLPALMPRRRKYDRWID